MVRPARRKQGLQPDNQPLVILRGRVWPRRIPRMLFLRVRRLEEERICSCALAKACKAGNPRASPGIRHFHGLPSFSIALLATLRINNLRRPIATKPIVLRKRMRCPAFLRQARRAEIGWRCLKEYQDCDEPAGHILIAVVCGGIL